MNVTSLWRSSLGSAKLASKRGLENPKSEFRNPNSPHDSFPRIPSVRIRCSVGECDWRCHRHIVQMGAAVVEIFYRVGFRIYAGHRVFVDGAGEFVVNPSGAGPGPVGLFDRAYVRAYIRVASALWRRNPPR